mgnify:CR=1 FL=1
MTKKKTTETPVTPPDAKERRATYSLSPEEFEKLKASEAALVASYSQRDADFVLYENAFKINPTDASQGQTTAAQARLMFDPQGHNVVNAIVRMYMLNRPGISVPTVHIEQTGFDEAMAEEARTSRAQADKIERWLRAALYASDLASASDFIADSLFAACIYGEVPQIIDLTYDASTGIENAIIESPFVFSVPSPRLSYPVYSRRNGLLKHVIETQVKMIEVRATYGKAATQFIEADDDDLVTLVDHIDLDKHIVWIKEYDAQPILSAALAHGFIPRTSRRSTSPGFFDEEEFKRMPVLFAYIKAGLWAARNVLLTATYSNVVDFMNPLMLMRKKPGGTAPLIDWSKRGSVVEIEVGEELGPLARASVTPEIFQFVGQVAQLVEQSTIAHVTAMPKSGGGVSAQSTLNILASSARVATYLVARTVEIATAQSLSKALRWIKARGDTVDVWGPEGRCSLAASEIGDNFRVIVDLKPDMQAEKQMVAGLAATLFERMHIGYDTALEMLEEGGIIESAEEAFNNIVERAFLEGSLPTIVKDTNAYGRKVLGIANQVPSSESPQNPAQPQMPAQPAQAIPPAEGAAPGALPRDIATGTQLGPQTTNKYGG